VNDVEALQRLLIDRYQCRPGHIIVLVHQNATEPKILTTLAALRQTTTATLMEGLSGKADDTKTGRIPVATLDLYLAERVKDLTQRQQKSVTVKPAAVGDFPLALVQ
jgi:hypothetical protein